MLLKQASRVTARAAALALVALAALNARADLPKLPEKAIADDTFLVVHIDAAKLSPESIDQTLTAVLGAQAGMAQQGMADYRAKYKQMIDAGAESITITAGGPVGGDKEPIGAGYIKLKPGADHAAFEKMIREEQAKNAKDQAKDMEVANEGDFMIVHEKGKALPTAGSADRAKMFGDAMKGDSKAVVLAFVPTPEIRAKMKEEMQDKADTPDWAKGAGPLLADSKTMTVDFTLGAAPVIGVKVAAADDASATKLTGIADAGKKQLQGMADQMKQAGPQGAAMAGTFSALADSFKTTSTGSTVAVSIDAAKVGPAVAQMLPMIMMGRNMGGGPGAGPKPGGGL